jgi:hypothetical protein
MTAMYRELLAEFSAECCAKLWRGEELSTAEFDAFAALLEAREMNGHRWLGEMAGDDPSLDTVTGRCGLPIARVPSWQRVEPGQIRGS